MQWDADIAKLVRKFNSGLPLTQDEKDELMDSGFFDDESEMYPHDEHVGLNPPWWEDR